MVTCWKKFATRGFWGLQGNIDVQIKILKSMYGNSAIAGIQLSMGTSAGVYMYIFHKHLQ